MAEDRHYYLELGVKVRYLHADIDTIERMAILRDFASVNDVLLALIFFVRGLIYQRSAGRYPRCRQRGFLRNQTHWLKPFAQLAMPMLELFCTPIV